MSQKLIQGVEELHRTAESHSHKVQSNDAVTKGISSSMSNEQAQAPQEVASKAPEVAPVPASAQYQPASKSLDSIGRGKGEEVAQTKSNVIDFTAAKNSRSMQPEKTQASSNILSLEDAGNKRVGWKEKSKESPLESFKGSMNRIMQGKATQFAARDSKFSFISNTKGQEQQLDRAA